MSAGDNPGVLTAVIDLRPGFFRQTYTGTVNLTADLPQTMVRPAAHHLEGCCPAALAVADGGDCLACIDCVAALAAGSFASLSHWSFNRSPQTRWSFSRGHRRSRDSDWRSAPYVNAMSMSVR